MNESEAVALFRKHGLFLSPMQPAQVLALCEDLIKSVPPLQGPAATSTMPADGVPFMYGIQGPDGKAHMGDDCVSEGDSDLRDAVFYLNDEKETGSYKVVKLYLSPTSGAAVKEEPLGWIQANCVGNDMAILHRVLPKLAESGTEYLPVSLTPQPPTAEPGQPSSAVGVDEQKPNAARDAA